MTITRPRLRHFTMVGDPTSSSLDLVVGDDHFRISTSDETMHRFLRVKRYFDGRHSIDEIASSAGVDGDSISAIVDQLGTLGILRDDGARLKTESVPQQEFVDRIMMTRRMWRRQIGFHRLWGLLSRGEAGPDLLRGLILETYHYVAATSRHARLAAEHTARPEWADLLLRYADEEDGHEEMILESLVAMGLKEAHVRTAHPVIGTMSLIDYLTRVARTDTFSYFACLLLLESTPEEVVPAKIEMREIAVRNGFEGGALDAVIRHMELDSDTEHSTLVERAMELAGVAQVTLSEAHAAVNAMHDLKHTFDQFHDQIVIYYSDASNYVPRLPVDFFSL